MYHFREFWGRMLFSIPLFCPILRNKHPPQYYHSLLNGLSTTSPAPCQTIFHSSQCGWLKVKIYLFDLSIWNPWIASFRIIYWLPRWLSGKESACPCRRPGFKPWVRKIPWGGHDNPLQYSCLENPMHRGACKATVHRIAKSQTWLKRLSMYIHTCHKKLSHEIATIWLPGPLDTS